MATQLRGYVATQLRGFSHKERGIVIQSCTSTWLRGYTATWYLRSHVATLFRITFGVAGYSLVKPTEILDAWLYSAFALLVFGPLPFAKFGRFLHSERSGESLVRTLL